MKSFVVNSKDAFDPKLNPGLFLAAEHIMFVRTLAEAKKEMDAALERDEQPVLDDEKLELIMTHVRYYQDMPAAYRRDVMKLVKAVLACKSLATAGKLICKNFHWDPAHQEKAELVARAILQFEMNKKSSLRSLANQELRALNQISKSWEKKR